MRTRSLPPPGQWRMSKGHRALGPSGGGPVVFCSLPQRLQKGTDVGRETPGMHARFQNRAGGDQTGVWHLTDQVGGVRERMDQVS